MWNNLERLTVRIVRVQWIHRGALTLIRVWTSEIHVWDGTGYESLDEFRLGLCLFLCTSFPFLTEYYLLHFGRKTRVAVTAPKPTPKTSIIFHFISLTTPPECSHTYPQTTSPKSHSASPSQEPSFPNRSICKEEQSQLWKISLLVGSPMETLRSNRPVDRSSGLAVQILHFPQRGSRGLIPDSPYERKFPGARLYPKFSVIQGTKEEHGRIL